MLAKSLHLHYAFFSLFARYVGGEIVSLWNESVLMKTLNLRSMFIFPYLLGILAMILSPFAMIVCLVKSLNICSMFIFPCLLGMLAVGFSDGGIELHCWRYAVSEGTSTASVCRKYTLAHSKADHRLVSSMIWLQSKEVKWLYM